MCAGQNDEMRFPDLLRDPLIRLVMESDGDRAGDERCDGSTSSRLGGTRVSPALRRIMRD
jgi:hypothetical protein